MTIAATKHAKNAVQLTAAFTPRGNIAYTISAIISGRNKTRTFYDFIKASKVFEKLSTKISK